MSDAETPELITAIAARGRITARDVAAMRATVFADILVEREEAEWLMALDDRCRIKAPEWIDFFADSVAGYAVGQVAQAGVVDGRAAAWLVSRLAPEGSVKTLTGLELLLRVMEAARSAPASLPVLALLQIGDAVLSGVGPLAHGVWLTPGVIGPAETGLARRILQAPGVAMARVARPVAEVLFDLNDGSDEAENDSGWTDLFVSTIGAFARAAHVASDHPALHRPAVEATAWLAGRIGRGGALRSNERALLRLLRQQVRDVHPSLRTLMDTAA